jgi:hypothetical protein
MLFSGNQHMFHFAPDFCNALFAAGCASLAWNITAGLPDAVGAKYVLNIWFPALPPNSNSTDDPQHFVLKPATGNNSTTTNLNGKRVQALTEVQAIVAIEPRRFFSNVSASNDYSYLDTPILSAQQGNNSREGETGKLVRRKREANPRIPAYIQCCRAAGVGSPPVGRTAVRVVCHGGCAAVGNVPRGDDSPTESC